MHARTRSNSITFEDEKPPKKDKRKPDPESDSDDEESDEEESDEEESDEEESDEEESDEEEGVWETESDDETPPPSKKSKSKSKRPVDLDLDSDDETPPPSKKSKSKSKRPVDLDLDSDNSDYDDEHPEDTGFVSKKEAQAFYKRLFELAVVESGSDEDSDSDEEASPKKKSSKKKPTKKSKDKRKHKKRPDSDDESEGSDSPNNISIIFASSAEDLEDEEAEKIERALNENDECNSEDEQTFMKETYEKVELPPTLRNPSSSSSKKSKKDTKKPRADSIVSTSSAVAIEDEYKELIELKKHLSTKLQSSPKSKTLLKAIQDCKSSINKLVKKTRTNNAKDYYKLISAEQKSTCEIDYFKKKLSHKEQLRIMDQLKEINQHMHIDKPYRLSLLQSSIPAKYKATVMHKLNAMRSMEPGDTEYHKMKNWIDTFMRVPFNVHRSLSVSMKDGLTVCDQYMKHAKSTLDDCVYGLEEAKVQILQLIGQWITNPDAMGTAIAIYGHPGTGKTSLVKDGISKILGREFAFIALGGAGDSSFLEGHGYTYEGSSWGKIVQILIDSKCMNPIIYFDELDKISDSSRGQEIASVLTHLTDTTQNCMFHDKFFSEIDFDLSKCLFIFSYNDESKVSPILRDRMYRIQTKGYDTKEKVIIAKKYILPKIREQVNFQEGDIVIPDDTLQYIIGNAGMTQNEHGVRNLKRCLEIIHTKLNLFRLIRTDNADEPNILGKDVKLRVEFPFTVTRKDVDVLIKNEENQNQSLLAMYV